MDISKYTAFFHDGVLLDIQHKGNNIEFSLASAEVDPEDIVENIPLSRDESIQGKVHLEGIKDLLMDDKFLMVKLVKKYEVGKIFDLELTNNTLEISISWSELPPSPPISDFSVIKIEAEKIWWENVPNLLDSYPS